MILDVSACGRWPPLFLGLQQDREHEERRNCSPHGGQEAERRREPAFSRDFLPSAFIPSACMLWDGPPTVRQAFHLSLNGTFLLNGTFPLNGNALTDIQRYACYSLDPSQSNKEETITSQMPGRGTRTNPI